MCTRVYKGVQVCTRVYNRVKLSTTVYNFDLTFLLDLASKSTPKRPFEHENPSTWSKVSFKSGYLYSKQLNWPHNHTWAKVDFLAPKQNQTKVKDLNLEQNKPNNFLAIKMEMNNNKKQQKNLLTKRYKSKIKQN